MGVRGLTIGSDRYLEKVIIFNLLFVCPNAFNNDFFSMYRRHPNQSRLLLSIDSSVDLSSLNAGMGLIADKYGEFHHSIKQESDWEMARYAAEKQAFAVITSDSDFLIFEGIRKSLIEGNFGRQIISKLKMMNSLRKNKIVMQFL